MTESITCKILENPNYQEIIGVIGDNPKQQRWKDHPNWGEELLKFHVPNTNLYVGAFLNNELVGVMLAHPDQLKIKDKIFKTAVIAITEVKMAYKKQGFATKMLDKLVFQAQQLEYDLVIAFQTAGRGGKGMLKKAGFRKIHKYGHATKVLDKKRMEALMDLNPVLKKLAMKIVNSDIGEINPPRGVIREAKDDDLDQIIPLLNQPIEKVDINGYWTKEYLKKNTDWRYKVYVLEDGGDILGSVITYTEISNVGTDDFTCGFLKDMVFKPSVSEEERKILVFNVLNRMKKEGIPNVSYPCPKPVNKMIKNNGFRTVPGDERTVFIKTLTTEAIETIDSFEKFKYVNVFLIC